MSTFYIFTDIFTKLETAMGTYIVSTATGVINFITPIFNNLLIIYLALWGIAHIRGTIEESIKDGLSRIIRVIFVVGIALNVGLYCNQIAGFLYGAPDQLSGVITSVTPTSAMLDELTSKGFDLGWTAWEKGGLLSNIGMLIIAIFIWAASIIVVGYAGFLLIFSKIAMVVLLAVGPIFIILILFQATQKFFEMWLGQVVNFGILIILSVVLIDLLFSLFGLILNSMVASSGTTGISMEDSVALIIAAVINFLILRQVPQIAMALGGGVALATQGFVSSALRKMPATSWLMATRPANLARSARGVQRDIQTTKRVLGGPGRVAGSLYRRRFGGNSVSGK